MPKFKKRRKSIKAEKVSTLMFLSGISLLNLPKWFRDALNTDKVYIADKRLVVNLPTGSVTPESTDWIVNDIEDQLSVYASEKFISTFKRDRK